VQAIELRLGFVGEERNGSPHEYGHSFMAWITGIKSDPWNIEWGDGSVGDILLLRGIDENVD
jgi:hypothetical protein